MLTEQGFACLLQLEITVKVLTFFQRKKQDTPSQVRICRSVILGFVCFYVETTRGKMNAKI